MILKLKKDKLLFLCRLARKLKISPCTVQNEGKKGKEKVHTCQKTKRQTGGFLNRYDFAYSRRDTVNQSLKAAPGIIKGATNEINSMAQHRIIK